MTMRLDLSANPGADSIRDHIAELERELDAARAREVKLRDALVSAKSYVAQQVKYHYDGVRADAALAVLEDIKATLAEGEDTHHG